MTIYNAMRELPATSGYREGDVLVLCGELFGRGYANGIVEQARAKGMTVIGATVGRRDAGEGTLRALNNEELAAAEELLGGRIINIPMEAGFDMEPAADGRTPLDQLKGVKPDAWEQVKLDWSAIEESRVRGVARLKVALEEFAVEVGNMIPAGANVLFVHTMAGGVPRARIFMPLFNRVFKGQGERFLPSEGLWNSDLGRFCKLNFDEVTADTFTHLIAATAGVRTAVAAGGGRAGYAAYGYHGCEVLINGKYTWQSYTPYLPGWSKIRLEQAAATAFSNGIAATVFNSPEIQTNSSALFMGVEVSLYPLLSALAKEGDGPVAEALREECRRLLKDDISIEALLSGADEYLSDPVMAAFGDYGSWPHHNTQEQAELMLNCSARLLEMNKDPKDIVCASLSRAVFTGVGRLMLDTMWQPAAPVFWLNHDVIAKSLVAAG